MKSLVLSEVEPAAIAHQWLNGPGRVLPIRDHETLLADVDRFLLRRRIVLKKSVVLEIVGEVLRLSGQEGKN